MRKYRLEQRRASSKRLIATILAVVYLCGSEGPMLLAFAAPDWFVRPGAGVSSQPLGVSSFGAPGFGELSQAVNMANGNVFASAGGLSFNNLMQSGDENTNKIGGSNWNLTSRLRLNGFSKTSNANFGTDNLTSNQNIKSDAYGAYSVKPNVLLVSRMLRQDSPGGPAVGCGNGSQSGVTTAATVLTPGSYRLTFDARADASLQLLYGLDTSTPSLVATAAVTTSWQTFTRDFVVPAGNTSSQAMAIWEATLTNPAWEVANLRSFRLDASNNPTGVNLIADADQDLNGAAWRPVCAKPSIQTISRLQKADSTVSGSLNYSGITRDDTFLNGTYRISLEARTRNGSLGVRFGVNDSNLSTSKTLSTTWQTLTQTFTVTTAQANRVFQIFEQTANNPDWELRNLSVQRISPGSFTLSSGDGSSRLFKQVTPNFSSSVAANRTAAQPQPMTVVVPVGGSGSPSWIKRYENATGTTFYALEPQPGTQYVREWIVLRQIGTNYVAHYYTADGSRATFSNDGEYADFMQNLYQQYRGAANTSAPDPEGIAATTLKTEISYTAANSGLISKIKDEWGRVTTYEWNTTDKTLTRINELLRDENINSTAARKTEFEYGVCFSGTCGNQRAVTKVTYTAPDGKGGTISRSTDFDYQWRANNTRLMLAKVSRSVLGTQNRLTTVYTYDSSDHLIRAETLDNGGTAIEPAINYNFTMTGTLFVRNNNLGEVTLKPTRTASGLEYRVPAKFATDLYEARLEPKSDARLEWTRNGNKAAPVQLTRGKTATLGRFNVRPNDLLELRGSQGASVKLIPLMAVAGPISTNVSVIQGTGDTRKETRLVFDSSGQLTQKQVWDYNPWIPTATWFTHSIAGKWLTTTYTYTATGSTASIVSPGGRKDAYTYDAAGNITKLETFVTAGATTPERSQTFEYDGDNRPTADTVAATSGTPNGANYNYLENKKYSWYLFHTATTGTQTFKAISRFETARYIDGAVKRGMLMDYDTSGRLTAKSTTYGGITGVNTAFTYHTGTDYNEWVQEPTEAQSTPAKQYADLTAKSNDGRGEVKYNYNRFGDLIYKTVTAGLASDVDASNTYTTDRSTRKDVNTMRGYNGFGQMVFEKLSEPGRTATAKRMTYFSSGELDSSWEGQAGNTTKYAYALSGANLGRVTSVTTGEGNGSSVTTPHETTALAYDAFGRVTTKTVDGFATTLKYDTLDRTVNTVLPNGKGEAASYHSSGVQDSSCDLGDGGSGSNPPAQTDLKRCTYNYAIDGLGRPGSSKTEVKPTDYRTMVYTYDPYDRPIKVVNSALSMVAAGDDQATYLVYDSEGNLTKQLGAVLGNDIYNDPRRPYTEYVYDNFNRKTTEKKLVLSPNPISPSSMVMPAEGAAGVQVATTVTNYDVWDRAIGGTDADGWSWEASYDPLGNVAQKRQRVCPDTTGECAQHFSDEDGSADMSATTKYAYDAAGRVTATVDARGNTSRVKYNAFGLPSSVMDARGITVKVMRYTSDGLPKAVWEPTNDNDSGTTATYIGLDDGVSDPANYVKVKRWQYGSRRYPTSLDVANMNTSAEAGAIYTQYQYDFAGRPTLTTLPTTTSGTATIDQSYDGRGNLTRLKDADGFVTEYKYDAWGQLLEANRLRRDGNTVDQAALPGNLVSTYTYDPAGNLATKLERGLTTEYRYNSLGKVKAETRPRVFGAATNWKYYTYRVDGAKTAETSYMDPGQASGLLSSQYNTVDCRLVTAPNITSGNAQCWQLTSLGRVSVTASYGISSAVGSGGYDRERIQWESFNGLGLRYKRGFDGHAGIYDIFRKANVVNTGLVSHTTYWRYDANGNLLKTYKRSTDGNGNPTESVTTSAVSVANPQQASEIHEFQYTPTNKERAKNSLLETAVALNNRALAGGSLAVGGSKSAPLPSGSIGLLSGTTIGSGGSTPGIGGLGGFTERDQIASVTATDQDITGERVLRRTDYEYYQDGSKQKATVYDANTLVLIGSITYSYDARGRLAASNDSTSGITEFGYDNTGMVSEHMPNVALTYRYQTVGGLTGRTTITTAPGYNGCSGAGVTWCDGITTSEYTGAGELKWTRGTWNTTRSDAAGSPFLSSTSTEHTFDAYGNLTARTVDGSSEVPNGSGGKQVIATPRTQTYSAVYNATNAMSTETTTVLGGGNPTVTYNYALSSRGQRLNMSCGGSGCYDPSIPAFYAKVAFYGAAKRYDADDRASSIIRTNYFPGRFGLEARFPASWQTDAFFMRYDAQGNLVLSAQARLDEYDVPEYYRELTQRSGSTVFLDGRVHLMHTKIRRSGPSVCNSTFTGHDWCYNTQYDPAALNQDETFSLYDGSRNPDPNYSVLAPFAAPSVDSSATPLQAPITPLSSQVRVEPSAIQAPGGALPSSDPSAITAPSSPVQPSTTAATQAGTGFSSGISLTNTTVSSQGVSAPSVGVQSFSVSNATTTATSSSTTQPNPSTKPVSSQPAPFSSQINLEPPSSVLPPSITPLSASSILAPSSFTPVLPASGEVSSIVAPGGSSVPVVGATPSSGTGTIVPPTSSVTPPGGSSGGIVKPGGGGSSVAVKPLDFRWNGDCVTSILGDGFNDNCKAYDLAEAKRENDRKIERATENARNAVGDQAQAAALYELAKLRAQRVDLYYPVKSGPSAQDSIEDIVNSKAYKDATPERKLVLWSVVDMGLQIGMGAVPLAELAKLFKGYTSNMDLTAYLRSIIAPNVNPYIPTYLRGGSNVNWAAQGASLGLSFVPFIGDGLGIATAVLGFDPITGEKVTGALRWLGLLGVIGLAEFAATARAARAGVNVARAEFSAGRAIVDCLNSFTAKTKVWVARAEQDVAKVNKAGQTLASRTSSVVNGAAKTALATIAVSSVAIGTPVLAFNEQSKQQEIQPVTATISHGKNDQSVVTLKLVTSNGKQEILETTPEHPFAVRVGQDGQIAWVNAVDLTKGQSIARADGKSGRLISRTVEARDVQLYNLTVKTAHTYYVGDGQWLVHNCEIPSGGRALLPSDLGINTGRISEFSGTISVEGRVMTVSIDMIGGKNILSNPTNVINSLRSIAAANGAESIVVSATVVNEELYAILVRRYGMQSINGKDFIVIPVGK